METYHEENESKEPLTEGMKVGQRYTLVRRLSGEEGKVTMDNSQVWLAETSTRKKVAIKFISIDYYLEIPKVEQYAGLSKKNKFKSDEKKLMEILMDVNLDYANRVKVHFRGFNHLAEFRMLNYSMSSESLFLVMDYYPEGNMVDAKDKYISKKDFLMELLTILYDFHKTGFSYNNLSPLHIMMRYDSSNNEEFQLIDFTRMTDFGEKNENPQETGFASLNALKEGYMYPYDDLESFLYITEYLMTGLYPEFESHEEQIEAKENLSYCSVGVAEMIKAVRELRTMDDNVSQGRGYGEDYENLVDEIYSVLLEPISELAETLDSVKNIPHTDFTGDETELVNVIMIEMTKSPYFAEMRDTEEFVNYAIKIKNVSMYGFEYSEDEMRLINVFLQNNED